MPQGNDYLEIIPKSEFHSSKQNDIQSRIYLDGNLQKLKLIFFIIIIINTLITILFFFLNWNQMNLFDWTLLAIDITIKVTNLFFSIYIIYKIKKTNTQVLSAF